MLYELREYVAAEGKIDELHARFRDHTFDLFARHGIDVVGFWMDGADRIVYLVAFADEQAQSAAWAAFRADPQWQEVKARSEAAGAIVTTMTSRTLTNPTYWTRKTTIVNA